MNVRRPLVLVVALTVAAAVAFGAVAMTGLVPGDDDTATSGCPISTSTPVEDLRAVLVPAAELLPTGSVGEARAPALTAVEQAVAGLVGQDRPGVVSGRFYSQALAVPGIVPLGEQVLLAEAPPGDPQVSLSAVSLPEGAPRWQRAVTGPLSGGGLVGRSLVLVAGGGTPQLVVLDADDGALTRCVPVPAGPGDGAATTLVADQAGADVITLAARAGGAARLARVDPVGGALRWEHRLGAVEAGTVEAFGDVVVVGRFGRDPVRLAEVAAAGGLADASVSAYDVDDGSLRWTFPADQAGNGEGSTDTVAAVIGSDASDGATFLLARTGTEPTRLVAVDGTGEVRWQRRLDPGYWDGTVVADAPLPSGENGTLLVLTGPTGRGGVQLVGYDAGTGRARWRTESAGEKGGTQGSFGAPVVVGGQLLVPAPGGLVLVDLARDVVTRRSTVVPIDRVSVQGDWLLVRAQNALLVVGPRA